jgi:phosphate:Na+ symporter
MTEDPRSAQHLLAAKRQLNAIERATGRRHLARLETRGPAGLEASTLHLTMLRDLRRVNSHLSAIAYDVLGLLNTQESSDEPASEGNEQVPDDTERLAT